MITAVVTCAAVAGYGFWSRPADPRRYPDHADTLAAPVPSGSLEAALGVFGLPRPCGTLGARYRDDKLVIGSGGTLHLRFATSVNCLNRFLGDLKLTPGALAQCRSTELAFPFAAMDRATYAEEFGWSFPADHQYSCQVVQSSPLVQSTIVVDVAAADRPVVYLVADRSEPES